MNFKDDELLIIKQLTKGYVLPITIHNEHIIQKLLKSTFLLDKKNVKLIKNYSIDLEDIFCAKIDTRFNIDAIPQEIEESACDI